jgi:hypothetical protein
MSVRRILGLGLAALAIMLLVRCGDDPQPCAINGAVCTQGDVKGVCFDGACAVDACVIDRNGTLSKHASGAINPQDGCQVCDPAASRTGWSGIGCPGVESACREKTAQCDANALGGACKGEECCVYKPTWDGQGTAPPCTYGAISGTCDAEGRCTGVCKKDADCATAESCRVFSCDTTTESCSSKPANSGPCDYVGSDDGQCVAGNCQKACSQDNECGADGSCGESGFCVAGRADGVACTADAQCRSGNCACINTACDSRVCAPAGSYGGARVRGADRGWRFALWFSSESR